jgi:HEAT repeat protein
MAGREEMKHKRGQKDPVEQLLRSKDVSMRLKAVDVLLERRDLPGLVSLLFSESWHVREKAAKALADFGKEVGDLVIPLLNEGYWYVRAAAAQVIGEIADERAFDRLKELLRERNNTVRIKAAIALAKIISQNKERMQEISLEEKILLENTLKAEKAFDLLSLIKEGNEGPA